MKKTSTKREYKDYILDIADSITKIEKFVGDLTFEEFRQDEKTVYAVVRAIEIKGSSMEGCGRYAQ